MVLPERRLDGRPVPTSNDLDALANYRWHEREAGDDDPVRGAERRHVQQAGERWDERPLA
jgi:hypothetical protein